MSGVTYRNKIMSGPPLNRNFPNGGLGCMIYEACDKFSSKLCHISPPCDDDGRNECSETFASFKERSARVAKEMLRSGVKRQDIIVNCCPNNFDNALTTAACMFIGAISSSLDPTLSERDCGHLLQLIEPKYIFVHETCVELIENAIKISGLDTCTIVVHGAKNGKNHLNFEKFLENPAEDFVPFHQDNLDETVLILFSSGSTGLAKAICLTHRTLFSGVLGVLDLMDDLTCLMHFTTFYWVSAILIFTAQFVSGSCRLGSRPFTAEETSRMVNKHKVTGCIMASPFIYQLETMRTLMKKYDISSLKTIVFAGGPIGTEQMTKARSWFPEINQFLGYGMTEAAAFVTGFNSQDRKTFTQYPGSCGRPMRGMQVKIVDQETGKPLNSNESGEIRYKTCGKINGYYKHEEDLYDSEGFIKSGDLGYFNDDYCIFVCDRIKDMFKYMSWHIVPAAIEAVIKEHPDVLEAVVFGVPNEVAENLPAAAIVLHLNRRINELDIETFVAGRVVDRQKLRGGVYFVDCLPKTPSGKLQRRKVRDMMLAAMKTI